MARLDLGPHGWLSYETPLTLFVAVVAAEVWRATAIVFIILVSGVQLIPKEYNEAAEVFGASAWTRFTKITLPLLKPSLQTALILRTILAFEVFAVVLALGGANIRVLAGEAYAWQNDNQNHGVAAAYAVVILALSWPRPSCSSRRSASARSRDRRREEPAMKRSPAAAWLLIAGVVLVSVWVLIPIYLLASASFAGRTGVAAWPKPLFPAAPTLEVLQFFFRVDGVWAATVNSLIVAG